MSDKELLKMDMGAKGTKFVPIEYPSNAHKDKEAPKEKPEEKKVKKVVTGSVVQRKKSFGKKFAETFIGDDIESVSQYLIHDVLIPAAKNTITDMVQGGIEMLLFGEKRSNRVKRDGSRSYVSYNNYSSGSRDRDRRDDDRRDSRNRARHNFDDIILNSRGEAEEVLSNLTDLTVDYGLATVADLYDLVGITSNFTDNKWGWTNLRSASITRAREGYLLNLPKPILVD